MCYINAHDMHQLTYVDDAKGSSGRARYKNATT